MVHGVRALVLILAGKNPAFMSRPQPVTTKPLRKSASTRPSLPDLATKLNTGKLSIFPKTELEKKGREEKGGKKQVTWN